VRAAILAALLGCALTGSACAGAKPWEREQLGRPEMAFTPDAHEAAFEGHVYFSKEGSTLGGDAGGGGCGCN
jgi:hypothetical protein